MTRETILVKAVAVAKFEIPVWSVIVAILIFLFNAGMSWQQFASVKEQLASVSSDMKIYQSKQNEADVARKGAEEHLKATDDRVISLDRRLITVEDMIIRNGAPTYQGKQMGASSH